MNELIKKNFDDNVQQYFKFPKITKTDHFVYI